MFITRTVMVRLTTAQGRWHGQSTPTRPAIMIGNRMKSAKGGFDFSNELAWQFGQMGQKPVPAWANKSVCTSMPGRPETGSVTRSMTAWKTRLAFNLDYASGDSLNNTTGATGPYGL